MDNDLAVSFGLAVSMGSRAVLADTVSDYSYGDMATFRKWHCVARFCLLIFQYGALNELNKMDPHNQGLTLSCNLY